MTMRFYVEGGSSRRAAKLAVFINSRGGVFIQEVTGTKYDGCPARREYLTKDGKRAKGVTLEEYKDCVRAACVHYEAVVPALRRHADCMQLVHDKAKIHHTKPLTEAPWQPVAHPPRSPDMMPLDYGIFGTVKTRLQREVPRGATWEHKVQLFKKILGEAPFKRTIEHFKLRMEACIESKGWHFEQQLSAMKRRVGART